MTAVLCDSKHIVSAMKMISEDNVVIVTRSVGSMTRWCWAWGRTDRAGWAQNFGWVGHNALAPPIIGMYFR